MHFVKLTCVFGEKCLTFSCAGFVIPRSLYYSDCNPEK